MRKRIARQVSFGGVLLLGAAAFLYAHDPDKKSMDGMCQGHHAAAMKASDAANAHLAEAKRAGTITDMRKHVELAEKALAEMGSHLSICMQMMHKMHGGMTGREKGMMGGTMPEKSSGEAAAAKVVDPVCNMEVDPAKAPMAIYNGKTYYFCSEADKEKFEKDPGAYVKKPS